MKIVMLSLFNKPDKGGGESRVVFELSAELAKQGVEVAIVAPGDNDEVSDLAENLKLFTIKSLGGNENPVSDLSNKSIERLHQFFSEFKPDIIHSHTISYMGLLGQAWAINNSTPFIYTAHESPKTKAEYIFKSPIIKKAFGGYLSSIIRDFFKNCNAIIALSNSVVEEIVNMKYKGPIFHIHNGRNLEIYDSARINEEKYKSFDLVYVGNICDRKNQKFLIEVMTFLPENFKLHLIGPVTEKKYFTNLQSYIEKNNLSNRVLFEGVKSQTEIINYLEKSFVFLGSAKFETFSLVTLEAFATGTPVIMLDEVNIVEWVPKPETIILKANSAPQDFAQQILFLKGLNEESYMRLCFNLKASVAEFNWKTVAAKTIDAYREVIKSKVLDNYAEKKIIFSKYLKGTPLEKFFASREKQKKISRTNAIFLGVTVLLSIAGYIALKLKQNMKDSK